MKINSDEFQNIITSMKGTSDNIEELFKKIDKTFNKLHNNDTWTGIANESYFNRSETLNLLFPNVNETLDIYIKFLETTLENYKKLESTINASVDDNSETLNVN